MLNLAAILAAAVAFTPLALAQDDPRYTVWSSVVLTRTGERTPDILTDSPTALTSIGANQAYAAGEFFRNRYISSATNSTSNSTNGVGTAGAPIRGLDADTYNALQTWVFTRDQQWLGATAQAFLQGFYPPRSPSADPNDITADDTYITGPLGGYQYPFIQAVGDVDPNYIYLDGTHQCPSFSTAVRESRDTVQFNTTQEEFDEIYNTVGSAFLDILPIEYWDYRNAYALYDYLRYEYAHNSTAQTLLDTFKTAATNVSHLDTLRYLADSQQTAQLGNLTAYNPATKLSGYRGHTGSISTIAGNFLASNILYFLSNALRANASVNKLNLLFADYAPFVSFFALANLPQESANFSGLPSFGASMVFELYSYPNSSNSSIPPIDDLRVRFLFRNGTEDDERFLSYPLFGRPKAQADMTWNDFVEGMQRIAIDDLGSWCDICGADRHDAWICAANDVDENSTSNGNRYGRFRQREAMGPVVAGVIGAFVALAIAALIFGAVMLLAGVRFRRNGSRRKSDLGGFKGGQKMASDRDLTIQNEGGAVVGATVMGGGGHERVGSWELGQKDLGGGKFAGGEESGRPSMEERARDPFDDSMRAVLPHERV